MFAEKPRLLTEIFLILILSCTGVMGQGDHKVPSFTHTTLQPPGAPGLEIFDDFDGDGCCDLLLCDNRHLLFYFNRENRFDAEPSLICKAPDDAIFIDVGDLDGDGAREPVFLSRSGVDTLQLAGEGTEEPAQSRVLSHTIAFFPHRVRDLCFLDFLCDITGDDEEDLIVPQLESYVIYESNENGTFKEWGSIDFTPHADFYTERLSQTGRLKEVVHLPRFFSGRDGERRLVVLYDGTFVTLHERSDKGGYEVKAKRSLFDPDSRPYEDESRAYFGKNVFFENLSGPDAAHTLVIAGNRNGLVDFYKTDSVVDSFESSLTLKTEGWILKPVFQDMNNDGLKDLILPSIEKIGIFTILRIFFTSKFDIHYMIFFNRGNPFFSLLPDIARSVSLPLSFTAGPEGVNIGHSLIFTFMGDFNGDGLNDFLYKNSPTGLGIFTAAEARGFSEAPARTLPITSLPHCSSATTRVKDLNGDGIDDLFLHQKSLEDEKDQYDLYLSTR